MRILGIDPGFARVGWGVIENEPQARMIDYGCFETEKLLEIETRLGQIGKFIKKTCQDLCPDVAAVEELYFAANAKTAMNVGQARGAIVLSLEQMGLVTVSYTPLQVKLAITGYGRAEKRQVQEMIKSILKLADIPRPDDAADALAIALTHAFSYKLRRAL